jgi:hypothetical protein
MLSITNVYTHTSLEDVVQQILSSPCNVFEVSPRSAASSDLSRYMVVAWTMHLERIPMEVGCVVPELKEPSVVGQHPLFL